MQLGNKKMQNAKKNLKKPIQITSILILTILTVWKRTLIIFKISTEKLTFLKFMFSRKKRDNWILSKGVKFVRDIVKVQREGNSSPDPPYVMAHGGAGAGKSHAINTLAQWIQYILQKPGDDINCPYVIKTAFTGAAASLIEGMTLHSAFGFEFGNKHYSLSDKIRDARKNILRNLKVIIIDEISMVKADMMYQLDLRLQEIKERIGESFGGISIFCFDDILQL